AFSGATVHKKGVRNPTPCAKNVGKVTVSGRRKGDGLCRSARQRALRTKRQTGLARFGSCERLRGPCPRGTMFGSQFVVPFVPGGYFWRAGWLCHSPPRQGGLPRGSDDYQPGRHGSTEKSPRGGPART